MLVSDPLFDVPAEIPFPPGTSPFRQKGQVYQGNFEFFAEQVPGGLSAALRALPTDKLRSFFEQRFSASEWYDALPSTFLHQAASNLRRVALYDHGRQIGVFHARSRMTGIYRAMLRVLSNENVAIWAPRISSVYYSFGKLESRVVGPRRVSLLRLGVPRMMVRWIAATMHGMGTETLKIAGARDVEVTFGQVSPDGSLSGYPLFRIEGTVSWV